MKDIKQLIEQARAVMTCPTCNRHYEANEIKFKGFMKHTYILQTACSSGHPTIFTTWITSYLPPTEPESQPIEADDIIELHEALNRFKGDFSSLWT